MAVIAFKNRSKQLPLPRIPQPIALGATRGALPLVEHLVPAGVPMPANDAGSGSLDLNHYVASSSHEAPMAFSIQDAAMEDSGLGPGDVAIIDRFSRPQDGALVLVRNGKNYLVRRFFRSGHEWLFYADDPAIVALSSECNQDLEVIGVVTHTIKRL
ncbi:MAG: LexA family protein [Holosporales bacterium]